MTEGIGLAEVLAFMKECKTQDDHKQADELLILALRALVHGAPLNVALLDEIITAYHAVPKWFD